MPRRISRPVEGLKSGLEEIDVMMHITQNMNAAEIINEISRLPNEEQGKVVDFLRHLPNAETIAAINEPLEEGRSFKSASELFSSLDEEC